MDKGMANIQEIQNYAETKANVNHMSKAHSLFRTDVIYEDPVYGDFKCKFQDFNYVNGNLVITGTHNDDSSVRYRVTLR